jgi:DNA modification methylase
MEESGKMKNSSSMEAYYYFKLKHNIQNDSELDLAKLEIERLMGKTPDEIVNFVDVISEQPLRDFLVKGSIRPQDFIMRLPYCGILQGYYVKNYVKNCFELISKLAYFREFFVLIESQDINLIRILLPNFNNSILDKIDFMKEVRLYDFSPYAQLFTIDKGKPKMLFRFIPLHTLYEPSDFICRLSEKISHVDRMFEESINHIREKIHHPFSPSSARWFKKIGDFIDGREAPQLYLTHYIFGIRGKFFPRMISAIMNAAGFKKGDWILDPFCGCGTMNVEATIRGINNIGVDMQPLFTLITDLKIKSMNWDINWLRKQIEHLLNNIRMSVDSEFTSSSLSKYIISKKMSNIFLPNSLMTGVKQNSLKCIRIIKGCIEDLGSEITDESLKEDLQNFCKLPLAYWMRSMLKKQDPEKIVETYTDYLWKMFFSVYYFHKFKNEVHNFDLGEARVYTGDVRKLKGLNDEKLKEDEQIDGIITSPPYGTAIDYIGEHVWALYVLDLTKDHLDLDRKMHIGTPRVSTSLISEIREKSEDFLSLPEIAQKTLLLMLKNGKEKKASAFYKYFVDMLNSFREMVRVLKPGKHLIMIIGKQQEMSSDGGIITVELGKIMEEIGKTVKLEHLSSVDILLQKASERGAIPTEHVIFFKKP